MRMTNEQVIKRINEIREILADYRELTSYDHEALDIAISALSKQSASSVPETGSICTKTAENDEGRIAIDLKKRTITERLIIAESLIDSVIADSDQFRDVTKKTEDVPDNNVGKIPYKKPEIIYCKDCRYRDPEDKKCDHGHGIVWQLPRPDDWFCADGKA